MRQVDYIILVLLFLAVLISLKPKQIYLFSDKYGFELTPFDDLKHNGNSKIITFSDSLGCFTKYFVGSQYQYPYIGASISKTEDANPINLSGFQTMIVEIDPKKSDNINCQINFNTAKINSPNDKNIKQIILTEILVDSNKSQYSFNLNELPTPQWWFQTNGYNKNDLIPLNFKEFVEISFSNHPTSPHDSTYQFLINKIIFKKQYWHITFSLITILIIYSLYLIIRKVRSRINTVNYKPVTLSANSNDQSEIVLEFIGKNYTKPDLSLETITKNTGIPSTKIRSILQQKSSMSFRPFINSLRIAEAQRLINNTQNPISEIALSVGYRHLSTFNSAFKEITGSTPSEFRLHKP